MHWILRLVEFVIIPSTVHWLVVSTHLKITLLRVIPTMTCQSSQVRFYVSLIGSGEGRHTTHLLKCVLLLSTSQTDWKQSSDVLSDISFGMTFFLTFFLTYLLKFFLTYLLTFFLTYLLTFFLTYLLTCFLTYLLTFFLTYQRQNRACTASHKSHSTNSIFTSHHAAKVISMTTLCLSNGNSTVAVDCIGQPRQEAVESKDAKPL